MVYYVLFLLLLPLCCKGVPQVIGPTQPIMATVGDDVILPCLLKPTVNAATYTVEWSRPDLTPRFVHLWRSGEEILDQNPSYVGRTSLFISEMKNGNISLKLFRVKPSDRGMYWCFIPTINRYTTVELLIRSVSSPSINISKSSSGVSLDCRSEGWFPQPELLWLDSKGRVLSAGPTETLKGPDGLFTVSSRLSVEKSNRDSFTCRVHQENINQVREMHIQVSADFFETSSSVVYISIIVVILLSVAVAAAFFCWKWRQIQTKVIELQQGVAERDEREKLPTDKDEDEKKTLEEKLEKKKKTLEEELQKTWKEKKNLQQMVHKLTKFSKEVHEQKDKLKQQREDMEKSIDDIEEKYKSAEKTTESDQAQGFLEMKTVALTAKFHLQRKIQEDLQLYTKRCQLHNTTDVLLEMMEDRKRAAESDEKKIFDQLKEIQKKLCEHSQKTNRLPYHRDGFSKDNYHTVSW